MITNTIYITINTYHTGRIKIQPSRTQVFGARSARSGYPRLIQDPDLCPQHRSLPAMFYKEMIKGNSSFELSYVTVLLEYSNV